MNEAGEAGSSLRHSMADLFGEDDQITFTDAPTVVNVATALKSYNFIRDVWLRTPCRQALLKVLDELRPSGGWPVTDAIALGLGSMADDSSSTAHEAARRRKLRSMLQLCAFLDVVECCRSLEGENIFVGLC